MALYLANATLAELSPPRLTQSHLAIDGGLIQWVGTELPSGAPDVVDCSGRLVIPGNVCAHTHLYSALARGMPAPPRPPRNFPEILEYVWWRLDRALDESGVKCSALIGALDAARAGTTTLVDHHASPGFIDGSLDVLADGIEDVGLRAIVCYEVTDRNGPDGRDAGLRENERFLASNKRQTVRGMVGAHASFTLEDETLDRLAELARAVGAGVHIHVAEDTVDEEDSLRRCGQRTAYRLAGAGILGDRSIAAHGVHLDDGELETVLARGSWLVHNCRSNLNNRVGRAPVDRFGDRSALGTDGIDEDMFAESRSAYFRAREDSLETSAGEYIDLLGRGGSLVSSFFPYPVGRLEVGAAADLVVLHYDPPTPLTVDNLAWHWMFALTAGHVESVMVAGRWVLQKGEICNVDEEKVRAEARGEAQRLWQRMAAL